MTEQQLYAWLMAHPGSFTTEIMAALGVSQRYAGQRLTNMERAGYVTKETVDTGLAFKYRWTTTEKATPWEAQEPAAHYGDGLPRVSSVFEYARSMA